MIKCLIVDDEPLAREVLEEYVSDYPKLELVASCEDAVEALAVLESKHVDLLFLDINMPKLSGVNFYKSLDKKPAVIFTTAYSDYAVEGFELNALDYLLKPFGFDRFIKAVNKFQPDQGSVNTDFIMLKADKKTHKIDYQQIQYFESIGDYVKVHLIDSKPLIIGETLRKLEDILPLNFLRIHKSYIISIDHIEFLEGNQAKVGDKKIPIGQSYRDKVNDHLRR